ncbi:transposase, partial [Burkholderia sp. Bp9126]
MVGLLYLKHAYNLPDEAVCERWAENNYWQYFCGEDYFQPRLPCNPTNLGRFRQALGEAGVEELLATEGDRVSDRQPAAGGSASEARSARPA